jgi:hypothetical protein
VKYFALMAKCQQALVEGQPCLLQDVSHAQRSLGAAENSR